MGCLEKVYALAKKKRATIILAEAEDVRVVEAAKKIEQQKLAELILIGDEKRIGAIAKRKRISLKARILSYETFEKSEKLATELAILRRKKGMTLPEAIQLLKNDSKFFAAMLVKKHHADGYVSGNICPTAGTIKPALQVLGTKEGFASSYFLLRRKAKGKEEVLFFADCGFNIAPSAEQLALIASQTAKSATTFGVKPRVAMLSFSTKGSASHESVAKMAAATKLAKRRLKGIPLDGELQFDAAFVPEVAKQKAPESPLKGKANIFIFPDLDSGNIAYKIAERLGGFQAIGPLLQGFKKPVNDLSRGCHVQDIVDAVAITAAYAKER
jgi:phosphate acetyltransferase